MHAMAQGVPEVSVASSSTAPNSWWEMHPNPPFSSNWSTMSARWPLPSNRRSGLPPQSYDDEADMPFTNASCSHSALSMDSSSADLSGEPENHHLWSQVLLNVENSGEVVHNGQDDAENFLEVLSSKRLTTDQVFDVDSSKKMDSIISWQELHPSALKYSYDNGSIMAEPGRVTSSLSDLVGNWSIAPPNPHLDHHNIAPSTCNAYISSDQMANCLASSNNSSYVLKHELPISPRYNTCSEIVGESSTNYASSYDHNMKRVSTPFFLRSHNPSNSTRYYDDDDDDNDSTGGLNHNLCSGVADQLPWSNQRNLSDQFPFGGCLNKPAAMELRAPKLHVKGSDFCGGNKQGYESSSMRGNGRGTGTVEGKKKRYEDSRTSETVLLKKSKYDSSNVSSNNKLQVPKVKMQEKISALQQLVSPFGKTDQASVLMETINCIKILQEQIQLLSAPYLKSSATKDQYNSWGGEMERNKDKAGEGKYDLKSKGLCLIPVSSIPQIHRENSRPDYWMPTYRSCFY